jgi:hypothetical protein
MTINNVYNNHHTLNHISERPTKKTARIHSPVHRIFASLKNIISFPGRYLGSKSWSIPGKIGRLIKSIFTKSPKKDSGDTPYHFTAKPLSSADAKKYLAYCSVTMASFKQDAHDEKYKKFGSWIDRFGFNFFEPAKAQVDLSIVPGNVQAKDRCFFDLQTGLKAIVVSDDKEVVICFGSNKSADYETSSKKERSKLFRKNIDAGSKNLLGGKVEMFAQADALFQVLKNRKEFEGKKIVLTGQCIGGSLASYVALKNEVPCIGFNTLPLGAGQQQEIGKEKLKQADKYLVHISAKGDYLSDPCIVKPFDRFLSFIGIRTPGNFGKRYRIPSAYRRLDQTHDFIMGSMMGHLGYDKLTRPATIKDEDIVRVPIDKIVG